jgi:hypothetical protein
MLKQCSSVLVCVAAIAWASQTYSQDVNSQVELRRTPTFTLDDVHGHTDVVNDVALIRGPNSNAYAVYSRQNKSWDTFAFPEDRRVSHVSLGESGEKSNMAIIGFQLSTGSTKELIAINSRGKVSKFPLSKASDGPIVPYLRGNGVLVYILSGRIYAYSGLTGTWDDIDAPMFKDLSNSDGTVVPPRVSEGFDAESTDGIEIRMDGAIIEFMPKIGHWKIRAISRVN